MSAVQSPNPAETRPPHAQTPATPRQPMAMACARDPLAPSDPLADLADGLAAHGDVHSLLQTLGGIIDHIIRFDTVSVMLYDPDKDVMRGYALGATVPTSFQAGNEYAMSECPQGQVWQTQTPVLIHDTQQDRQFAHVQWVLRESGIRAYSVLPLTTARGRLGALAFGSQRAHAFDACDPL
jgi:transcriptional regulator with GAF, ATPase, and Fis domain